MIPWSSNNADFIPSLLLIVIRVNEWFNKEKTNFFMIFMERSQSIPRGNVMMLVLVKRSVQFIIVYEWMLT
jgi:hypothetical protein